MQHKYFSPDSCWIFTQAKVLIEVFEQNYTIEYEVLLSMFNYDCIVKNFFIFLRFLRTALLESTIPIP